MKIKCFDILTMTTDEATEQYYPDFVEDAEKKSKIEHACSLIDAFIDAFECSSMEVSVNDETKEIVVSIICESFEMWIDTTFKSMLLEIDKMNVEKYMDDVIRMDLIFNSMWVPCK